MTAFYKKKRLGPYKKKLHKLDVLGVSGYIVTTQDMLTYLSTAPFKNEELIITLILQGGASIDDRRRIFLDASFIMGFVKNLCVEKIQDDSYLMGDVYITRPELLSGCKIEDTRIGMIGYIRPTSPTPPDSINQTVLTSINHFALSPQKETT